jgi:YidC/Oxa1 family membrane protein insertase
MSFIFNTLLYRPLLNALVGLYLLFGGHDFGLAVIILTAIIRLLLWPFWHSNLKQQKVMAGIQKEMKQIQEKHKDDKEKQLQAVQELYKRNKINPFSSLLFLLIQLPILWALYRALFNGLKGAGDGLYSFVPDPGAINYNFLGLIDLQTPSLVLIFLAAVSQYWLARATTAANPATQKNAALGATTLIMPFITGLFLWKLPAAIALYWTVTTIISIIQQTKANPKRNGKPQNRN